jgi:hypothetical protein
LICCTTGDLRLYFGRERLVLRFALLELAQHLCVVGAEFLALLARKLRRLVANHSTRVGVGPEVFAQTLDDVGTNLPFADDLRLDLSELVYRGQTGARR